MLLSELHPYMRALVPMAPIPVINQALIDSTRELCRQTNVWRHELEPGDLSREGAYIVMSPPENTAILRPYRVEYGDVGPLKPATPAQLSRRNRLWRDYTGDPMAYVFVGPDKLQLYPSPEAPSMADFVVTVSLMPALSVTELDDRLAVPYSEVIRNIALGRLMLMPGRTWSNEKLGAAHLAMAASAVAGIEEEGTDSGVRNLPRSVRYGGY